MYLKGLITALKSPNKKAIYQLTADAKSILRFNFRYAAIKSGLADALREPATKESLDRELSVVRPELLNALLDLGLALGELTLRGDVYRTRGRFFHNLATDDGDSMAAVVEAFVTYYNSVYRHLPSRLAGEPPGDYLNEIGKVVARFSRLGEPYVESFLKDVLSGRQTLRVLDVGCGSGGYLRLCSRINARATGVGLERDGDVAALARENLGRWGIEDRFHIVTGDLRREAEEVGTDFHALFLINALYYTPPHERTAMFQSFRECLADDGKLIIVSHFQGRGKDIYAANLDAATCSIQGCWPLPDTDETKGQLEQAGFSRLRVSRLMPLSSFQGIVAHTAPEA